MYLYEFQRNTFFKWIVVPYFLWALLSLICSIYVAKIALQQVKRASQVHPLINLAQKPQLKTTESNSTLLKDVERGDNNIGEGSGNCSKDNQLIVEEIDEGFDEDKPSTTDATKIISINGSETKGFQNNLPMITMIECPSPCIEPSTSISIPGYLSPSISTYTPKQRLSPCRFRKFPVSIDAVGVMVQSTSDVMRASSESGNSSHSQNGKYGRKENLTLDGNSCDAGFKFKRLGGEGMTKEKLFIKKESNNELKDTTILKRRKSMDDDDAEDETMKGSCKINIIRPSPTINGISFKCRPLRNVSKIKRIFPSNTSNWSGRQSPTFGPGKGKLQIITSLAFGFPNVY